MLKQITEEQDSYSKVHPKELNTVNTRNYQPTTKKKHKQSPINQTEENRLSNFIPTIQNRFLALNVSPSSCHETTEEPVQITTKL